MYRNLVRTALLIAASAHERAFYWFTSTEWSIFGSNTYLVETKLHQSTHASRLSQSTTTMGFNLCISDSGDGCGGSFTFETSPGLSSKRQKFATLKPDSEEYVTWAVGVCMRLSLTRFWPQPLSLTEKLFRTCLEEPYATLVVGPLAKNLNDQVQTPRCLNETYFFF